MIDEDMDEVVESITKSLIHNVFSWSLTDVLNDDLYKDKVEKIPQTFPSLSYYLESFISPLVEETRAELRSNMDMVSNKPIRQIVSVEAKRVDQLLECPVYIIESEKRCEESNTPAYEPNRGDLIALTNVRPKSIDDLDRPTLPYLIALVQRVKVESEYVKIQILSSRAILPEQEPRLNGIEGSLFAVFLVNLSTNIRIWSTLKSRPVEQNTEIIARVLQPNSSVKELCSLCLKEGSYRLSSAKLQGMINPFNLNDRQTEAILKCFVLKDCHHDNTVKLIWGPPGTGKTKTIAALLFALLGHKCRAVTCTPTNIAVLEVTARLLRFFLESNEYDTYGLGDIVLFGNEERMQIIDHAELHTLFLNYRAKILAKCFAPASGWEHCLDFMICLLEDPEHLYQLYLTNDQEKNEDAFYEGEYLNDFVGDGEDGYDLSTERELNSNRNKWEMGHTGGSKNDENKRLWKNIIAQSMKLAKDDKCRNDKGYDHKRNRRKFHQNGDWKHRLEKKITLNIEEFAKKRFKEKLQDIKYCILYFIAHLPTSVLSHGMVNDMRRALHLLENFNSLLHSITVVGGSIKDIFNTNREGGRTANGLMQLNETRNDCLQILRSLPKRFFSSKIHDEHSIKNYILDNACLFFCTAASSIRLQRTSVELLIVDEAAQLKECESTIPLRIPGLRHAILIGDECQLPAMINSKICQEADFGRSLFERLALMGHRKHLLDVQYRMHPSISLFPNKEFYQNQILNAPNVKQKSYEKSYLHGEMYCSYSFINIECGSEEVPDGHSRRNMVEVAVVCEVIANLYEEFSVSRKRISIGVVSPYNAQVAAIKEILGKKYEIEADNDFSVSVRSIDGFQGGEKDLIIISTVRCNGHGSIGFLSNRQRTNVAITRARYGLWIIGHAATLSNSNSVWKKLVLDAKIRKCFYDAHEDRNLAKAMIAALVDTDLLDVKLKMDYLLQGDTRFKVLIYDNFWRSIAKINSIDIRKKALSMLVELSSGSCQSDTIEGYQLINGRPALSYQMYTVDGLLQIILMVDSLEENASNVQVLKVWDIFLTEVSRPAGHHKTIYENYTSEPLNHTNADLMDCSSSSEVSTAWPADSAAVTGSSLPYIDPMLLLSQNFADLMMVDE